MKIVYPKVKINRKQKIYPKDIIKMQKLREQGWTLQQVADKFNVHVSTVFYKTSESFDPEKFKAEMRIRNNKRYAENPDFREKLKQQVQDNQRIRMKEDMKFRKYKLDLSNEWNRKNRERKKKKK